MDTALSVSLLAAIVFFAAFVQSLSGFGFAVIIMPLTSLLLGLQTAAPLVALTALTVYAINLIRYRRAINTGEVLRLGLASVLGVPVGIWLLANVEEGIVMRAMGLLLLVYATYALMRPRASSLLSRRWVYPAGFLAGCLGGAYNTPGPPAIVYGQLRQWPRDEFRAAMQALFFVNGALVAASHHIAGHLTADVLTFYLFTVPALAVGIAAGTLVDQRVNRDRFRLIVTGMILVLGLALILG
jgi:uncharacterized membrane protein YfcA